MIAICIVSIKRSIAGPTIPQLGGKSLSVICPILDNPDNNVPKSTPVLVELKNKKNKTMKKMIAIFDFTRHGDNIGAYLSSAKEGLFIPFTIFFSSFYVIISFLLGSSYKVFITN